MRGMNLGAATLATICGVLTAYTTFGPELEEDARKRAGKVGKVDGIVQGEGDGEGKGREREKDTQLSRAIMSDLNEAKKQVVGEQQDSWKEGGFAWGIRKWFWSSKQTNGNGEEKVERKEESG
ncbi:hypothetical protein CERZMDRAFT_95407 [Cercospora zeae-maydis SCOH1-5]|uniref:Uncharacterized protein n=1 Tax=Cercospora zeae-maydis SCOH1-5 TaxID=717836 RepID=A0A6A6FNM2_9PEZI|nr:hypothetical protein CERZMDRAFT_95407 [Cercospora zeae-maydis SCOH1-5]